MQPLKIKNKKNSNFRVTVKIFRSSALSQKVTFQSEILELGFYNNLGQHEMCPIFSSKIIPPKWTVGKVHSKLGFAIICLLLESGQK